MQAPDYDANICPVSKTLELISGKWKPIILYLIQHQENRFGLLRKKMPKISKKVLTAQLRAMEEEGLITRELRVVTYPQEVVYTLTPKGQSLRELIEQIFSWGMKNILDKQTIEIAENHILTV